MTATVHPVMLVQSHSFNYSTFRETVYSVTEFFHHDHRAANNRHEYLKYFCCEVVKCASNQQCTDKFVYWNIAFQEHDFSSISWDWNTVISEAEDDTTTEVSYSVTQKCCCSVCAVRQS